MCRWLVVISAEEMGLSRVVLNPSNSLVRMSYDASFHPGCAETNNATLNGDGFGVGWYYVSDGSDDSDGTTRLDPAVYKDTQPAWNNPNLVELCKATKSTCILAHVRAAIPGSIVSRESCQPFKAGRLLFCHNGHIEQFSKVRRRLLADLCDETFLSIQGATDSEAAFGLLLSFLNQDSPDGPSPHTQQTPYAPNRLVRALEMTIKRIVNLTREMNINTGYTTCNFCLTDGETVVCSRFCDKHPDIPPPSLYYSFGASEVMNRELSEKPASNVCPICENNGEAHESSLPISESSSAAPIQLELRPCSRCTFVVASIPLTSGSAWHKIEPNSILFHTRGSTPQGHCLSVD